MELHRVEYAILDDLAVQRREALHQRHIVKVIVAVGAREIRKLKGDLGLLPAAEV